MANQLLIRTARELAAYDRRRESVIAASRSILREAKGLIFLSHEGKEDEVLRRVVALARRVARTERSLSRPLVPRVQFFLNGEGSWLQATEEFLEAWFLVNFLKNGTVAAAPGIRFAPDVVVGALSDFTGELVRAAVMRGAEKDMRALRTYRAVTVQAVKFMLPLRLTGQSRLKADQAKKNLKRIEEIIYDVAIRT